MNRIPALTMFLVFLAGFITAGLLSFMPIASATNTPSGQSNDVLSPQDHINESQILVYDDKVVLDVKGVKWASIADTNSMDPFIDVEANVLQLVPESEGDIGLGDIISYTPTNSPQKRIIHRVVYIGDDDLGTYYVLKGDNNPVSDPGKIRFDQIDRVLIAVIY